MEPRSPCELLTEIKATTKLGEIALSKALGVSQPTVNRILNGKNCNSTALLAIQRMHANMGSYASTEQAAA
jgi:plasmid maintenance system antidote protein VapI